MVWCSQRAGHSRPDSGTRMVDVLEPSAVDDWVRRRAIEREADR